MFKYTRFQDIPQIGKYGSYSIDVAWTSIESQLRDFGSSLTVNLDPDFQRGHVWTRDQQIAYLEHILQGGQSGREILWNCASWNKPADDDEIVLVDGKQRLTAARRFLAGEIPAFGTYFPEYTDELRSVLVRFKFYINDLPTKKDVLKWYLAHNGGGVPHSREELSRVQTMIEDDEVPFAAP